MSNDSVNIYKAPGSDLGANSAENGVHNFERFSAWGVFGLSLITLGIYQLYWLYTRAKILNTFHEPNIAEIRLKFLLGSFIGIFVIGVVQGLLGDGMLIGLVAGILNIVYVVIYFVVLFGFRGRLINIINNNVNPVLTFFGAVIYLQYKINQAIDDAG